MLQGCVITENIHFNNDFSGKLRYDIDMTQFMAFSKMMAENAEDSAEIQMEEIPSVEQLVDSIKAEGEFTELENMEGVSNFSLDSEGETMIIQLEFSDIDALNRAYSVLKNSNAMGGGEMMGEVDEKVYFTLNKKTLTYEIFKNPQGEEPMEGQDEMNEMIQFETVMSFDKTIKGIEGENMEVNQDGNQVSFSYNLGVLTDDSPNPKIIIKLK